VEPVIGVKS